MRERAIEDWLTRINERGYQAAFGQILASVGAKILRISHSPYEHGKDVLAIAPDGQVDAYQLKDGDIGTKEWEKGYAQVCALIETRPSHPSLPSTYAYRPWLVTNGIFTDPALDRIKQHNMEWERRGLPPLGIRDGRWMHGELVSLSTDFWPTTPPDVRRFRRLYLVDGRGDFDAPSFAEFLKALLVSDLSRPELERRVAAANVYCSYILGEFYRQQDHWSVFRGWIMAAASIAGAQERAKVESEKLSASFNLARDAAEDALHALAEECRRPESFTPTRLEWDEYTRVRNTITMGAWSASSLLRLDDVEAQNKCVETLKSFINDGRLTIWGEGAFPFFCAMAWVLEQNGEIERSVKLLVDIVTNIANHQQRESLNPFRDPYTSPEEVLKEIAEGFANAEPKKSKAVQSYCLFPLILMMVRREGRDLLSVLWRKLSRITMTIFHYKNSEGYLEWSCEEGDERDFEFQQPQSWSELERLASSPPVEKLPSVLRSDSRFRLMFTLAFPHRLPWSIVGSLDHEFLKE